jgi:tetratricopeptide (TPR) repeat protein
MQTYLPLFRVFLFLQFLFPSAASFSQEEIIKIGEDRFPIILKKEIPTNELPGMTYIRTSQDFIEARGQGFQSEPPKSTVSFIYEGDTIQNIGDFNNKALALLEKRNKESFETAKKMFLEGAKRNPIYFPFHYNLGRILSIEGNMVSSLEEYRKAISLVPEYYRTHLNMGKIYEAIQDDRNAESSYKQAIKLSGFEEEPRYALCSLSLVSKNVNAYKDFGIPKHGETLSFHGSLCSVKILLSQGKTKKSFEILKTLKPEKEVWSVSGDYNLLIANLMYETFQKEKAREAYKKVLESPYDPIFFKIKQSTIERRLKELE